MLMASPNVTDNMVNQLPLDLGFASDKKCEFHYAWNENQTCGASQSDSLRVSVHVETEKCVFDLLSAASCTVIPCLIVNHQIGGRGSGDFNKRWHMWTHGEKPPRTH